jgi:cell surface protein SprA
MLMMPTNTTFYRSIFVNNYDKALANIPIISSNVNITKIEVWTTNRTKRYHQLKGYIGFYGSG